jgi:hypothetical protein
MTNKVWSFWRYALPAVAGTLYTLYSYSSIYIAL